jgi:hypothetical protein
MRENSVSRECRIAQSRFGKAAIDVILVRVHSATIRGMKLQFRTATLLAFTAFVAIACGGYGGIRAIAGGELTAYTWRTLAIFSPLWLPLVFAAYACGRRKLTALLLVAFAIGEAASLGIRYLLSD